MITDWCEFFRKIEENPRELVKAFTVLNYLQARQHLGTCKTCRESAERVVAKYDKENGDDGTYKVYTTLN